MNEIRYEDADSFYDGIKAMIERGLIFDANYDKLIITLTGGY